MQRNGSRRRANLLALAALFTLGFGCGGGGFQSSVKLILVDGPLPDLSDAHSDAHSDAAGQVATAGRCCALQVTDASVANCATLGATTLGVVEPCLMTNSQGAYGRWTCGTGAEPRQCGDNGFACAVGDPCLLVDVGCPGIVQTCDFKPQTPPPG